MHKPPARPVPRLQRANSADLLGGTLVVFLGATWFWMARDFGLIGEGGRVDAGTLPALAGGILAVCGLVIVASGLRPEQAKAKEHRETSEEDRAVDGHSRHYKGISIPKAAIVLLVLLIGLVAAPVLGFSLTFALFVFTVIRFIERRSLVLAASAAVGIWAMAFFGFELLLDVPLPETKLPG